MECQWNVNAMQCMLSKVEGSVGTVCFSVYQLPLHICNAVNCRLRFTDILEMTYKLKQFQKKINIKLSPFRK